MTITTTNPAHMLPAITATRAARIEAAHSRHQLPGLNRPCIWSAKPNQAPYCPAHLMTPEQLENSATAAAVTALQRREQSSGLNLMRQVLQSARANSAAMNLPAIAAEALHHEALNRYHNEQAARYQAIADRKTTDPTQAKAARMTAKEHRQQAAEHLSTYTALNRVISTTTHTDLSDIQSAAKLAIWQTIADPAAPVDYAYINAVKAASKAIDTSASASALTSTRTVWIAVTPEAARDWNKAHPGADRVFFNVRESARAGYITLEFWQPKNSKRQSRRPVGWYLVRHYNTVPPCISYEQYTDTAAGQAAVVKNDGINAIQSQSDSESISDLLTRANLTAKEQEICYKVIDQTAAKHAAAAEHDHMERARATAATQSADTARKTLRRARAKAAQVGADAAIASALDRASVYAERTRRRYLANIRTALEAAQTPKAIQTAEEQAERERRQWEQMQRGRTRATAPAPIAAPDIIGAVARAAESVTVAAAVVWLTDYPAPVALTPEEAAQSRRAAAPDGYIFRAAREHQSKSPWSNAGHSAAVLMGAMTAAEVDTASKATRAAEAAEAAKRDKAARLADSARKVREEARKRKQDPAAAVAVWLDRIGAPADLLPLLTK